MNIDFKDFLENNVALEALSNAIAEKLVDKLLYTNYEKEDDWGRVIGWDKGLKESVENRIFGVAREVVVSETKKVLQDDFRMRDTIREKIKEYICRQFEEMTKGK